MHGNNDCNEQNEIEIVWCYIYAEWEMNFYTKQTYKIIKICTPYIFVSSNLLDGWSLIELIKSIR